MAQFLTRLRHMVLHTPQNANQLLSLQDRSLLHLMLVLTAIALSLRRLQVLGGPCFALHPLWPPSRMHVRVPLTSGDGSHDPTRFLDRDRTLRASQSSLPWTM